MTHDELTKLFDARVTRDANEHGCWMWNRKPMVSGYGRVVVDGVHEAAHRFSWRLHRGPVPEGKQVLHDCDRFYPPGDITNRRCVNPDHLFLGTCLDNMRDKVAKGRQARNLTCPLTKICDGDAIVVTMLAGAMVDTTRAIGRAFRITSGHVSALAYGDGRFGTKRIKGVPARRARLRLGELNHAAKLTKADVYEIRRLVDAKLEFQRDIGARYRISQTAVGNIGRRKRWGHLPELDAQLVARRVAEELLRRCPKPEAVEKTPGQVWWEAAYPEESWEEMATKDLCERGAAAVIAAHEAK